VKETEREAARELGKGLHEGTSEEDK